MAQKVSVTLVSDVSGKDIKDGDGETVSFQLDNSTYEIDVTSKEADALRGLFQDYIAVARKVGRKTGTAGKRTQVGTDAKLVRAWANENGLEVPERGRIPADIREKYEVAH